jgi:uncharacterized protein YigA (DUF484 family)
MSRWETTKQLLAGGVGTLSRQERQMEEERIRAREEEERQVELEREAQQARDAQERKIASMRQAIFDSALVQAAKQQLLNRGVLQPTNEALRAQAESMRPAWERRRAKGEIPFFYYY